MSKRPIENSEVMEGLQNSEPPSKKSNVETPIENSGSIQAPSSNKKSKEVNNETCGKEVAKLFCEKLNSHNFTKPTVLVTDLECDYLYSINFIRHYSYRTNDDIIQNIQIDLKDYTFLPPFKNKIYVMKEIFGLDETGKKMPSKGVAFKPFIKDDVLTLPGLGMRISKNESNNKIYYQLHFTVVEDEIEEVEETST